MSLPDYLDRTFDMRNGYPPTESSPSADQARPLPKPLVEGESKPAEHCAGETLPPARGRYTEPP